MATPQRLPIVNSDDGTWGDIIRQYLKKEHYDDGTDNPVNGGHQNVTIRPGTTTAAPLTFNATGAALLSTPADGAVEYASGAFYITTGTTRKRIAIFDDTNGAAGDIYSRDSTGNLVRFPIGNNGQVLKVAANALSWGAAADIVFNINTQTTSYTIGKSDAVVFADATSANVTITLPSAPSVAGYRFYVKRIDASTTNTVTVSRSGSDTIDGMTSLTLDTQYTAIAVVSSGATWYIL